MSPSSAQPPSGPALWVRRFALPSLPELFFAVLLLALFGSAASWQALLFDGDAGWHIRTGQLILQSGTVPRHDPFSFSRPDQTWFAWEWLADVIFARFHAWGGLEAVAGFAAVALCASGVLLLCWLLRRGVGLWIALGVTLGAISASTIHYLARPHLFSLLMFPLALWILDEDRRRRSPLVWILAPLSALWANLHGGFAAWLATLALLPLASAAEHNWSAVRRYASLTVACAGATLANPYGWHLHAHIFEYLRSSWILDNVQEFQSPRIRDENMLLFAALLLAGVALSSRALARRQWFEGALVLVWALAALRSARHIPFYVVVAAPVIASECASWWASWARGSPHGGVVRVLWGSGQEIGRSRRLGPWAAVLGAVALWLVLPQPRIVDFPASRFPAAALSGNLARLTVPARVLTSDQWADYLIFRLYPRQRVFFDGRSDFYGPALGADYQVLLSAAPQWPEILSRYDFDIALLPFDWPLGSVLERDPHWELVYRDHIARMFVRRDSGLKETRRAADRHVVGG